MGGAVPSGVSAMMQPTLQPNIPWQEEEGHGYEGAVPLGVEHCVADPCTKQGSITTLPSQFCTVQWEGPTPGKGGASCPTNKCWHRPLRNGTQVSLCRNLPILSNQNHSSGSSFLVFVTITSGIIIAPSWDLRLSSSGLFGFVPTSSRRHIPNLFFL